MLLPDAWVVRAVRAILWAQAVFNEIIFKAAQQENEAEGLPTSEADAEGISNR